LIENGRAKLHRVVINLPPRQAIHEMISNEGKSLYVVIRSN